eukprot:CAMPEP_0180720440 /NCGR_PEP_ID=MMETSP1038_2-20121128/15505_1 /TAXON_ID=632150 /ORGANISM="Azadinium spinosum, Strain 3D9" /LENGTH=191 /DNA_ID=CAMNT_0022752969 /DNA_START=101 /DNA_END=673 /DNA_ORIENTATION=-
MVASASALIIGAPPAPPDETLDCGCMNWRDTFISGAVMAAPSMDLSRMLFLSDMGNVCIGQGKQWCYVSSACDVLNGGVSVNEKVATKFCTAEDERLSDKTMPELIAFAAQYDLSIYDLVKVAYASQEAPPVEWTKAKAYFTGKEHHKPLSNRDTKKLEAVLKSGVPMVLQYDVKDGPRGTEKEDSKLEPD